MPQFHIATPDGPAPVEGQEFIATIGDRTARLFIHKESALEGARLSCQRSGMMLGKLAPLMLARFVATGDPQAGQETVGAAMLINQLVASHGPAKLWRVMDAAPDLFPSSEGAAA